MIDLDNTMAIPELLDFMFDDIGIDFSEAREATRIFCTDLLNTFEDEISLSDLQVEANLFLEGYEACMKNHNLIKDGE